MLCECDCACANVLNHLFSNTGLFSYLATVIQREIWTILGALFALKMHSLTRMKHMLGNTLEHSSRTLMHMAWGTSRHAFGLTAWWLWINCATATTSERKIEKNLCNFFAIFGPFWPTCAHNYQVVKVQSQVLIVVAYCRNRLHIAGKVLSLRGTLKSTIQ